MSKSATTVKTVKVLEKVSISKLSWELNPREGGKRPSAESVAELAESIASVGLVSPPLIVEHDKKLYVVAGGRRCAAAASLGRTEIDAFVFRGITLADARLAALAETHSRRDYSALDTCRVIQSLVGADPSNPAVDQRTIAKSLGVSQAWVSQISSLGNLCADAQKELAAGSIRLTAAVEISKLPAEKQREVLVKLLQKKTPAAAAPAEAAPSKTRAPESAGGVKRASRAERLLARLEADGGSDFALTLRLAVEWARSAKKADTIANDIGVSVPIPKSVKRLAGMLVAVESEEKNAG